MNQNLYKLGIDIGSTTVKIAILDENDDLVFSDYERHFANIQDTLAALLEKAYRKEGDMNLAPMITGSGGLTLAKHLGVPFVQEVISVSTALQHYAPQTDVAIELGGEDAKIIYFEGGNVEQRMNGICAGGTGSFIDQMASLIQTDAPGLNEYAKNYKAIYPIAARCGVFAKTDIQPLINRARKADIRKRQLGIQLTRFARQLKLSGRQQGDFIVAEHAFIHPVNGVAHRARHGRNRQKTERAVRQRDGNLHRQQHAFRREQLLRAGQRHGHHQNGAERKGRQPADDFFHRVSSFYR